MIRQLFQRKPSYEAELLAEAQALVDDGLEVEFVLGLFPDDADWLEGMLTFTSDLTDVYGAEQPSYYFEASLKSQFLGAGREPKPVIPVVVSAQPYSPIRTAIASMSVASAAAVVGVVALGFMTAGGSVPGDWNYTFKIANERLQYSLSRGDGRVDVQLQTVENRVYELQKLSSRGDVSPSQLERVQREIDDLKETAQQNDLDQLQRSRLEGVGRQGKSVIADISQKQPSIPQETVDAAAAAFDDVVTLGVSGVHEITPTASPSPTASAGSATPEGTATPVPSTTATPSASPTTAPSATATETETPAASKTAEPSATSTALPNELETVTPSSEPTP